MVSTFTGKSKLSTKQGRYGSSKLKAFTVLASLKPGYFLSVRQLCLSSGIDYYTLGRALPRWVNWDYVARYPTSSIGEGDFMYKLLSRGASWLELAKRHLPNAEALLYELEYWQTEVITSELYAELLSEHFAPFVARIHKLSVDNRTVEFGVR